MTARAATVKEIEVEGYDEFWKAIRANEIEATKQNIPLIVIVKSSREKNGKCWCRDCESFDQMLMGNLKSLNVTGIMVTGKAGTLEQWLQPNNKFKSDEVLNLEAIPTAFRWKDGKPVKMINSPAILNPQKFKELFSVADNKSQKSKSHKKK